MFKNGLALALAGAVAITTPAYAAQERDTRTTGVTHADLNLATEEGREELDRRIERAAKSVCGMDERATGSNMRTRESRNCYRDAKRQLDRHFADLIEEQNLGG